MFQPMKSRKEYMDGKISHREYYGQFVTDEIKAKLLRSIPLERIKNSKDEHLNDIPLGKWDAISLYSSTAAQLKECGDWLSLGTQVCILKEAAEQIKEQWVYLYSIGN